jgi:hypothetical protein
MKQNPAWEADSHSARQEIQRLLWNPQHSTTDLYPESDVSSPHLPNIHSNIILPFTHLSHACCLPHPSHPPLFDHYNSIWWTHEGVSQIFRAESITKCKLTFGITHWENVKLSLCLTKHHVMKAYWEAEV